jgi:hypothetical protein
MLEPCDWRKLKRANQQKQFEKGLDSRILSALTLLLKRWNRKLCLSALRWLSVLAVLCHQADVKIARKPGALLQHHLSQRALGQDIHLDALVSQTGAEVNIGVGINPHAGAIGSHERCLVDTKLD